jgi:hypothetical protein
MVMLCRELGIFRQKEVRGAFEGPRSKEFDPRDRSDDSILDPRPEPLYEPTQSHTSPTWNEVSVHKAKVSAVDKASLKTLPTSYEYAVYIMLLYLN